MKITVDEKKGDEIKYPCLMTSKYDDVVYLTSYGCGARIRKSRSEKIITDGYLSKVFNMEIYRPFTGSITLEND